MADADQPPPPPSRSPRSPSAPSRYEQRPFKPDLAQSSSDFVQSTLSPELQAKFMRRRSANKETGLDFQQASGESSAIAAASATPEHRAEIEALRNSAKSGRRPSRVQEMLKSGQFSGSSVPVTLEAAQTRDRRYRDQQLEQQKKAHQLHATASSGGRTLQDEVEKKKRLDRQNRIAHMQQDRKPVCLFFKSLFNNNTTNVIVIVFLLTRF